MVDTPRTTADLLANLFQDGQAANSITAQDVRDLIVSLIPRGGYADYNDLTTATTPITVTGGAGYVFLTNDGAGPNTNKNWVNPGITDIWDPATNAFDFTELDIGDTVDMRLDVVVTTTAPNQTVDLELLMDIGGTPFSIPFVSANVKTAGAFSAIRFTSVYLGSAGVRNNPAKFRIQSDGNATVRVNGWYCRVGKM